jgi:hypothetical protein
MPDLLIRRRIRDKSRRAQSISPTRGPENLGKIMVDDDRLSAKAGAF